MIEIYNLSTGHSWKSKFANLLASGNLLKCIDFKSLNFPDYIFRYRHINDNTLNEIKSQHVYLCQPCKFNDPFDCYIADLTKKISLKNEELLNILNRLKKSVNVDSCNDSLEKVIEFISDKQDYHISDYALKVTCFTEELFDTPINLPMWYHYANRYSGVCIKYSLKLFDNSCIQKRNLFPVLYTDNIFDFIFDLDKIYIYALISFIHKSKYWNYENEWRLLSIYDLTKDDIDKNIEEYIYFPIESIYLGYNILPKEKQKILDLSEGKYDIYEMKLGFGKVEFNCIQKKEKIL